jgi:hypothetical protein
MTVMRRRFPVKPGMTKGRTWNDGKDGDNLNLSPLIDMVYKEKRDD